MDIRCILQKRSVCSCLRQSSNSTIGHLSSVRWECIRVSNSTNPGTHTVSRILTIALASVWLRDAQSNRGEALHGHSQSSIELALKMRARSGSQTDADASCDLWQITLQFSGPARDALISKPVRPPVPLPAMITRRHRTQVDRR